MILLRQLLMVLGMFVFMPLMALERVSVTGLTQANGNSFLVANSADGRYVAFDSDASNLVGGDSNGVRDVFIRDRTSASLERVSISSSGAQSSYLSRSASISTDGRYISFESMGTLAPGVGSGVFQIYRRDRVSGVTELVSSNSSGVAGTAHSMRSSISADGRYVLFYSSANNLIAGDNNSARDVFIKDMQTGGVERISVSSTGVAGNGDSFEAAMSSDTRFISFTSMATNLTGGTIARQRHTYLRDRQTGSTKLISKTSAGVLANQPTFSPALTDDGRYVVYYSKASNLAAGTSGANIQILLYDGISGNTALLSRGVTSHGHDGPEGNDLSYSPSISADGRFVAFTSFANNLISGDNNGVSDILLLDRQTNELQIISQSENGELGNGAAIGTPALSRSGNSIAFSTYASNLLAGDTNNVADIFVHDRYSNSTPVAKAGSDQRLQCSGMQTPVSLDGRASEDADGDDLNYVWSLAGGEYIGAVITVPLALGSHTATLNVDDQRGGASNDNVTIEIMDTTAPALELAAEKVLEAESRSGSHYQLNATGSDLCSAVGLTISPTLDLYPLGETLVTVTASDSRGNTTELKQRVRVEDTTAPELNIPADIRREANAKQTMIAIGLATATDIFDVVIDNDAPASFSVGSTTVKWQATDSNGNSSEASQNVTIEDTTAPEFSLLNDISLEATAVRTPLTLDTPVVKDIFQVTLGNNAPADYALGDTPVTWRAEDEHGNVSEAQQTVHVVDTTAPLLTAPVDLVIEASGELTPIQLATPVAKDIFPVTIENNASSSLVLGQHKVTWIAKDSSGNSSQATQLITIQDTTAPVLEVVSEIVVEAQGQLTAVVLPEARTSDLFTVTVTNNAPLMFPLGSSLVTWQAVDSNGNQAQVTQLVRVVDTTAPAANIEQLRDSIWPPNNKLVKVARISGLTDLVDLQPQLDAVVEWEIVGNSDHHQRPERRKQARQAMTHGDHARRGGAHSSKTNTVHASQSSRNAHRHASSRAKKANWKLIKQGDEWYLYVRASVDGRRHSRVYNISINLSDSSGNQASHSMQVSVEHRKHHEDRKLKHHG